MPLQVNGRGLVFISSFNGLLVPKRPDARPCDGRASNSECVPQPTVVPFGIPIEDAGKIRIMADGRGQIGDRVRLSGVAQGIAFGRQIHSANCPPKWAVAGYPVSQISTGLCNASTILRTCGAEN